MADKFTQEVVAYGLVFDVVYYFTPADKGCNDLNSTMLRPPEPAEIEITEVFFRGEDIVDVMAKDALDTIEQELWAIRERNLQAAAEDVPEAYL